MSKSVPGLLKCLIGIGALGLLLGCEATTGASSDQFEVAAATDVGYAASEPVTRNQSLQPVGGSSQREASQNIAASMAALGLRDVRVSRNASRVTAVTNAPAAVDCGTILVRTDSGTQEIPANSTLAVLPIPGTDDFVRRQFQTTTNYIVDVAPMGGDQSGFGARVGGRHDIRMQTTSLDGTQVIDRTRGVAVYGKRTSIGQGVVCESSNVLDRAIWK